MNISYLFDHPVFHEIEHLKDFFSLCEQILLTLGDTIQM